jgi:hypothetical protein
MTEFNSEPLWVGMDVDAELARYAAQDRSHGRTEATPPAPKRSRLRRALRAAVPSSARGGSPRYPLAA